MSEGASWVQGPGGWGVCPRWWVRAPVIYSAGLCLRGCIRARVLCLSSRETGRRERVLLLAGEGAGRVLVPRVRWRELLLLEACGGAVARPSSAAPWRVTVES